MKLLVLVSRSGDHCNRLFQSLHFHAYCLEHKIHFWNPTMLGLLHRSIPLPDQLGDVLNNYFLKIPLNWSKRFFPKLLSVDPGNISSPIGLVAGWQYRSLALTQKYHSTLARFYQIKKPLSSDAINFLNFLERKKHMGSVMVGLHVRRGDYKDFYGGKYYYQDLDYLKWGNQIREYYSKSFSKDVYIVVCSNEASTPKCGQDSTSTYSWFVDLKIFQKCDLLIGPPSTFTAWASYVSQIPCIHFHDVHQDFDAKAATIIRG